MNLSDILGQPVRDVAELDRPATTACAIAPVPEPAPEQQPRRPRRLWALAVAVALAIGFGAGAYITPAATAATTENPAVGSPASAPPNIGDFAELFVALHLSGATPASDLAALFSGDVPPAEASGVWVNRSAALSTEPLGTGLWTVIVAVDALEMTEGSYEPTGIQYFEINVAEGDRQPVAVSAPARVPGPAPAGIPVGMPVFDDAVPADQTAAVASFLEAYLTGQGETVRYAAPTARFPLFPDAPYESIAVGPMGADAAGRVRVQVEAATGSGGHHNLEYTLELTFESGVWEVSDLVPAAVSSS